MLYYALERKCVYLYIGNLKNCCVYRNFLCVLGHGLTPLIMYTGTMYSRDFQNFLNLSVLPLIETKMPYNQRLRSSVTKNEVFR